MTNCEWINSKLEAYFTNELPGEERQRFQTHLGSCSECSAEVESFKDIDSVIRGVFERRLAVARQASQINTRPRVFKIALATTGLAVAALVLAIGMTSFQQAPAPPLAIRTPTVPDVQPEVKKDSVDEANSTKKLAKPGDAAPAKTASDPSLETVGSDAPDFVITDDAGYTKTLENYRGSVFLFGVISHDQKDGVAGLQQIYNKFAANREIRIVGISRHRDEGINGATFPILFNHGSKLLGVPDGHFLLMDSTGKPRMEGSLTDTKSVSQVRTQLERMGVK